MLEMKDGCVKPVRGPLVAAPESAAAPAGSGTSQEVTKMTARVGMEANRFLRPMPLCEARVFSQSSSPTTRASGLSFASTRVISPSCDRRSWRRSPPATRNSRSWVSKSWR
jgi:hypothetical protein